MQQIDVDFDVFKALTACRKTESHTYNDVIRELLDLDSVTTIHGSPALLRALEPISALGEMLKGPTTGISFRGLFLPNGTRLRATHKGTAHGAQIIDGKWVGDDGTAHNSPSAAASAITQNNVNGWRFWQAKRPSDSDWRNLDMLPKERS